MRSILITLLVFGMIPYALARPYIALYLYVWLSLMNPHRLSWGFAYDFPFAEIAAITTLISLFFSTDRQKIQVSGTLIIWILWILWMCITTFFAFIPENAMFEWERAMKIQLMAFLPLFILNSKEKIIWFVAILAVSLGFYGIKGGVHTLLTGGHSIIYGPPGSFFEGNNGLAVALLMVIPLIFYLYKTVDHKWGKRAILFGLGLCGLTMLASYSRGAFLGILAIIIYFIMKSDKKVILGLVSMILLAGFILMMPQKWMDRIETIQDYEQDRSAMGRINAWQFGYNVAKESPIVGGGFGVYTPGMFRLYAPTPEDFHDSHSIYFEALAEQGFVGLFLFLLLGIVAFRTLRKMQKDCKNIADLKWAADLAFYIRLSLIGYAVSGAFVGIAYAELYYYLIATIVVMRHQINKVLVEQSAKNSGHSKSQRRQELLMEKITH